MTKYDELCDVAIANYVLVTAKEIDALGIYLKDVLEWSKLGRMEKRGRGGLPRISADSACKCRAR